MKPKKLLKINWDAEGIFKERLNRFVGIVDLPEEYGGPAQAVHVHDPGRLKELLYPGARVALKRADKPGRKTSWTLIAARHHGEWVLVNSGLHRQISQCLLTDPEISPFSQVAGIVPEVRLGKSRLDYRLDFDEGPSVFVEVKGCTLAVDGIALFPDAPTARGSRHVQELIAIMDEGFRAGLVILIFRRNVRCFSANGKTDPGFAQVFRDAMNAGVEVYPVACAVEQNAVWYEGMVDICNIY